MQGWLLAAKGTYLHKELLMSQNAYFFQIESSDTEPLMCTLLENRIILGNAIQCLYIDLSMQVKYSGL